MKDIEINVVNAFSINGKGGNPAGVVVEANTLSTRDKQLIAKQVGLSETAFVSRSVTADVKLEFFTPVKQIAHCGHATIATFSLLKQLNYIKDDRSSKETIDGTREILFKGNQAFMEQSNPNFQRIENYKDEILHAMGLTEDDLLVGLYPLIVNTGNSFLIVPLKNSIALQNLKPDLMKVKEFSNQFGLVGFYVFTVPEDKGSDATARMFAPRYGIDEEAATGMAAGPLACYLYTFITRKEKYTIHQGVFMNPPSPSLIHVHLELEHDKIKRLFAGGNAHVTGIYSLHLTRDA